MTSRKSDSNGFFRDLPILYIYETFILVIVLVLAKPNTTSLCLGIVLSLLGATVRVWTRGYPKEKNDASIYGPYKFVRHPHQLGTFLILLGLCVASRSPIVTAMMLLGSIFLFREVFKEEEKLGGGRRGVLYQDYRLRVPTFIPALLPYKGALLKNNYFSLSVAMGQNQKRELNALFALVFVYILLFGTTKMAQPLPWQLGSGILVLVYSFFTLLARRRHA